MTLWDALRALVGKLEAEAEEATAEVPMTHVEAAQLARGREMVAMMLGGDDG